MGLKVTNILTTDTFEVFPPWRWENQSGIKVRVAGIEAPYEGESGYETAKAKLKSIVKDKGSRAQEQEGSGLRQAGV